MRDGEIIYHHPVGYHREGERRWHVWCDDCDWTAKVRSRSAQLAEWHWHLAGMLTYSD